MIMLILGTPGSGKSQKAEDIVLEISKEDERIYVATMIPYGSDGEARIQKHRRLRDGKGFVTLECPIDVDGVTRQIADPQNKTVLLECMSNLAGNEMHSEENRGLTYDELVLKIVSEVMVLGKSCKNMIIVSNSFREDDESYDEDTKRYVRLIDDVNKKLKEEADKIYELTLGEWKLSENN